MEGMLFSSGDVAEKTGMSRSCLIYRIKKTDFPDATYRVAKRRVFTEGDLAEIQYLLRTKPKLRQRRRAQRSTV